VNGTIRPLIAPATSGCGATELSWRGQTSGQGQHGQEGEHQSASGVSPSPSSIANSDVTADLRPLLADPLVVDGQFFLRGRAPRTLVRLPSPPFPARSGDQSAGRLTLYRHLDVVPGGGGLLEVALDLGSPWDRGERAEAMLPPDVSAVTGPHHLRGRVRLWCMGQVVASSTIPAGVRPVLPLSAGLSIPAATFVREAANTGRPAVFATAEGWVAMEGGDRQLTVEVDVPGVRRALAGSGVLTPSEVADAVQDFLSGGVARVSAPGSAGEGLSETMLVPAFLAAALFQPESAADAWSLVPGLALAADASARLRSRPRLREGLSLKIDGGALPWCAAAPLTLTAAAVSLWDLVASRVITIAVMRYEELPPDVIAPRVEAQIGDGPVCTAPLTLEQAWLRMLSPDPTAHYRWRIVATRPDGMVLETPWTTNDLRSLAIGPAELSRLEPQAAH
jgi:hypothetical protein